MPEGEDQTLLSSRQRGDGSSCVFTTLTCPDLPQRSSSAVNRTHGHCIQTILYSVLSSMLLQLYQLTSLSLIWPQDTCYYLSFTGGESEAQRG